MDPMVFSAYNLYRLFLGKMSVNFSSYTQMCCGTGRESPELPWCAGFLTLGGAVAVTDASAWA